MSETSITVEVHALQPRWIYIEQPKYRLYVNNDLITERTWIWDLNTFIGESMYVDVPSRVSHTIRLELIKTRSMDLAQFELQNLKINGLPMLDHGGHRSELSFILE
jgi:hypothetical protein